MCQKIMRISGLEPFNYVPNEKDYRKTFINLGERCNVAGSVHLQEGHRRW